MHFAQIRLDPAIGGGLLALVDMQDASTERSPTRVVSGPTGTTPFARRWNMESSRSAVGSAPHRRGASASELNVARANVMAPLIAHRPTRSG